jgi:hypothetical protein
MPSNRARRDSRKRPGIYLRLLAPQPMRLIDDDALILELFHSPFAQSTPHILNFKLPIEMSTQPQPLQDSFLHP